jgi:hypothetical protein
MWHTPSHWGFVILKRWNSFTPALAMSEGGGYFLYHEKKGRIDLGVVVDPGYGFVRNFLLSGFGIKDIHAIVVSHDHPDHVEDFGRIVNLLVESRKDQRYELEDNAANVDVLKPIWLGLSEGALSRLQAVINKGARDVFRDTYLLTPGKCLRISGDPMRDAAETTASVCIKATKAIHKDSSLLDSIGLIMSVRSSNGESASIGLPSDSRWSPCLVQPYLKCDVVCLHVGSVYPDRFKLLDYFNDGKTHLDVIARKQHLYLPGVLWFSKLVTQSASPTDPPLLVFSEFGEEMGRGLRVDFVKKIKSYLSGGNADKHISAFASDVGFHIDPYKRMIRCSCCGGFYPWWLDFDTYAYGEAEELFYICPSCREALHPDQRHRLFERLSKGYDSGTSHTEKE